jgi:hypothetical protein
MTGYKMDLSDRLTARAAVVVPNAVSNATLTVTAATAGTAGNNLSVKAVLAGAIDTALSAAIASNVITITLGTDGAGLNDATKNTGTLVAAAVDALSEVGCTTSGTGAGVVVAFAQQPLVGGHDVWSQNALAKAANVSLLLVKQLEYGGNCDPEEATRLCNALGVAIGSVGTAL